MNVDDIRRIAVVGGGLMGSGIAQEFAAAGYDVALQDIDEDQLQTAVMRMRENLTLLAEYELIEAASVEAIVGRVTCTTKLDDAVSTADLVVEAAVENVEMKQNLFRSLSKLCPRHTILASTTSAIPPDKLAEATDCPERVVVTHFAFPNYLIPLVEMARAAETSDETVQTVYALLEKIGKRPIIMKIPLRDSSPTGCRWQCCARRSTPSPRARQHPRTSIPPCRMPSAAAMPSPARWPCSTCQG